MLENPKKYIDILSASCLLLEKLLPHDYSQPSEKLINFAENICQLMVNILFYLPEENKNLEGHCSPALSAIKKLLESSRE